MCCCVRVWWKEPLFSSFLRKTVSNTLSKPWCYHFSYMNAYLLKETSMGKETVGCHFHSTLHLASPFCRRPGKRAVCYSIGLEEQGLHCAELGFPLSCLPFKGPRDWKLTTLLPWPNECPSTISTEKQLWENVAAVISTTRVISTSTLGLKVLKL